MRGTLQDTIECFLTAKESENKSPNTIRAYRADLTIFVKFIGEHQSVAQLSRDLVRGFLAWNIQQETAKGSVRRKLMAIKSFIRWLNSEGILSDDVCQPILDVRGPKPPENLPDLPSPADVSKLLDGPFPTAFPERDRLILELLYGSGLRVSEAANILLDDFQPERRGILIRGKGGMFGLEGKERLVPFNPYTERALASYLPIRAKLLAKRNVKTRALFVALNKGDGDCINVRTVRRILLQMTEVRGLQAMHPHLLRHCCASHMLNNNCPLEVLAHILGHSNLDVTAHYCQVSTRLMMDSYQGAHPYAASGQKDGAA